MNLKTKIILILTKPKEQLNCWIRKQKPKQESYEKNKIKR